MQIRRVHYPLAAYMMYNIEAVFKQKQTVVARRHIAVQAGYIEIVTACDFIAYAEYRVKVSHFPTAAVNIRAVNVFGIGKAYLVIAGKASVRNEQAETVCHFVIQNICTFHGPVLSSSDALSVAGLCRKTVTVQRNYVNATKKRAVYQPGSPITVAYYARINGIRAVELASVVCFYYAALIVIRAVYSLTCGEPYHTLGKTE
jgi:hypothetical protein